MRMYQPFLAVLVVLLGAELGASQYMCSYNPNYNVSSPDLETPTILPSAYDCCSSCSLKPGCAGAVYDGFYYCHLKGSVKKLVPSVGGTAIIPQRVTPTTTATPTTATNAPTTTTVPKTTVPPHPTRSPTPPWNDTNAVIYSTCAEGCNYGCTEFAYPDGECQNSMMGASELMSCNGDNVTIKRYISPNCAGTFTTTHATNAVCINSQTYFCVTLGKIKKRAKIKVNRCAEGCDYNCSPTLYEAGKCYMISGTPVVYECFEGGYVIETLFSGSKCAHFTPSSVVQQAQWYPTDTCIQIGETGSYQTFHC